MFPLQVSKYDFIHLFKEKQIHTVLTFYSSDGSTSPLMECPRSSFTEKYLEKLA